MTIHARPAKKHLPQKPLTLMLLLLGSLSALPASAQLPTSPAAPDSAAPAAPSAATAPPGAAQEGPNVAKPKQRGFQIPKIGVDAGVFLPASGKTRKRFGNSWADIGIGVGRPDRPSGTGRVSFDFSTEYKKSGGNHAFAAPIGVSYRRAFRADDLARDSTFIPYYGFSANLVVVDLRSVEDDVHSRFRLTEGGSLVLGTTIGASGFAEGKYTAVAKVQGFDLSGLKLTVGIRF